MSNGLDAMHDARKRRGKPEPMHPRHPEEGQEQSQAEQPSHDHSETPTEAATSPAEGPQPEQQQPAPTPPKPRQRRSSGKQQQQATTPTGTESKQVNDLALGWSAAARKLAGRGEQLRAAVEAARAAGTPQHVLLSHLSAAEHNAAGVPIPDEVWHAAGLSSDR